MDIKKVGEFIYQIRKDGIAVAGISPSRVVSQIMASKKLTGYAHPTGNYYDLPFENNVLRAAVYTGISEDQLRKILSD